MKTKFLLVTCCLEKSRTEILNQVITNLIEQDPSLKEKLTVFDNASTDVDATLNITNNFDNVYRSDRNVGYWSAIDWWLTQIEPENPDFTYIIESDMIHYAFEKVATCAEYLSKNVDVGSVRLHEYSVAQRHLYDKDSPKPDSRRNLWQSHTNKATGQKVKLDHSEGFIWSTTFLTQLPALNRYKAMKECFNELRAMKQFSELDFQKLYWDRYKRTGIVDGGIFHCDINHYGTKSVTGSWTPEQELKVIGYQPTRYAQVTPIDQYTVNRL